VYTYFAYASAEYISATERAIREYQPKVVHLDSLDLSSLLDLIPPSIPVSICHHNIESRLLEVRATQESPLRASYLRIQSSLMRKEEAVMAPKVKVNFTVSEPDRAELLRIAPTANVVVAPNGVDTALRLPVVSAGKSLIFVGGASWFPNRDALEYFGSDILPLIRKTVPGVTVHWIGQCTDQLRDQIERRFGITLVGYADDLTRYLQDSALFIVPLRVGGGTRLKILDAWAWQLPVVSTSVGCEGLDARNGQNIVIADSPAEFSDAVVKLLTEKELREKIAREGRVTAMQKYDWTYIGKIIRGAVTLNSVVSKLSAES
jgi:glycosyltransferase involved in cell wall biosynthesis